MLLTRRGLIAGSAGVGTALLSGCDPRDLPVALRYDRISEEQYGLLMLPRGRIKGTVIFWHGGLWLQLNPVTKQAAEWQLELAQHGYASWAPEYRRIGSDGGFPNTFIDVAEGMDALLRIQLDGVDTAELARNVILAGYSSGGQLATWAASRRDFTPGGAPRLRPKAVVAIAAPLTMAAITAKLGPGPVTDFMGGSFTEVPDHYYQGDPMLLVPANMPVAILHDRGDQYVAPAIGETYCAAARAAGGQCSFELIPGDHLTLGTAQPPTWRPILAKFMELLGS